MTIGRRRKLIRRQRTGTALAVAATISFLAGMTDAIGLLSIGDFVSFMSGNTTRAAIALGDGNFAGALILLGALVAFIVGNALGVIVAARRGVVGVLTTVSLVLMTCAGFGAWMPPPCYFYGIVLSMGLVNAAVEHIEGLPIGLTYVTGALSRFGRGLGRWLLGNRNRQWLVQIVPWLGMFSGAVAGAVLQRHFGAASLWASFALSAGLALATILVPSRWSKRYINPG
ncbi:MULTISPECIES: YoaK family protein [unclassified Ensifer]|uniref:YoaK family protein n=1 Tax=unclassified Ensifer TaxID=2633371 RepID=UPI000813498D|nr:MULTISPECIES: YoaK family protein [unclassified Ensifer]OCP07142.1 hypothetical protein BBX50_22495 [Ensifer sp. LC11]OCP07725.1 hypothetical protein BC374_22710 [Ensifer sp. LC13]OCP12113.1 hypothetical protein BC362_06570 [Ensifer sp. LC14]OCP31824.1 hypothetical protein BC364_21990 [Ensifer sp. LC499]